jgi:biuret amidohydrolase
VTTVDGRARWLVEDTAPYPWPWDGTLRGARLALVITGTDRSWIDRSHDIEIVRARIDELAAATRDARGLVVHLLHGAAPTAALAPAVEAADIVVTAAGVDGFYGSALDVVLRGRRRDQLAITGFGLEATVHSTMRSANDQGYECLLVTDACAPLDPTLAPAAISMVTMSGGIFGAVGTSDPLLAALAALPRDPHNPEDLP